MDDSLANLTTFNEQVAALVEAGVSLDVGLAGNGPLTANALRALNSAVTDRASQGETLAEAFEGDEPLASTRYRCLVRLGMQSGSAEAALKGPRQMATVTDQSRSTLRRALYYPLVVCTMAYLGLLAFCSVLVPRLEGVYQSLRVPPGVGLKAVEFARQSMPYWGMIPVVGLAVWGVGRFRSRRGDGPAATFANLLPGMRRSLSLERAANFADAVAELLESGVSRDEAMRLAACASGDAKLSASSRAISAAARQGDLLAIDSRAAREFPPLLRWAVWQHDSAEDRGQALRLTADIYRAEVQRRSARLRAIAPVLTCVLVAGVVTLLYCLALFVPLIELLEHVALSVHS
jgi:type II secretory pathway component PulF